MPPFPTGVDMAASFATDATGVWLCLLRRRARVADGSGVAITGASAATGAGVLDVGASVRLSAGVLWVLVCDVDAEGPNEKVRDLDVGRVVEEDEAFLIVPGGLDRLVNSRFGSGDGKRRYKKVSRKLGGQREARALRWHG